MSWPATSAQRTVLAPAGHPPVDQPRVAREAVGRPEAQPLGHAGPEALDEDVDSPTQVEHDVATPSGDLRSTATERRPRSMTGLGV